MDRKNLRIVTFVVCIALVLCACQNNASEYQQAQQNVLIESELVSADTGVDLSTPDKVYEYADVVLIGTVSTVSISSYRSDRVFPYSKATVSCEQVFKGDDVSSLTFSFAGGYVPITQYMQKNKLAQKNLPQPFTDKQLKSGYAHIRSTQRPEFQEGQKYVIFLSKESNGEFTTLGSDYSVLEVKNGSILDFEGKTYGSVASPSFT